MKRHVRPGCMVAALAVMLAAETVSAGPVTISASTNLVESQSALYTNDDVTVSGGGVILTLSNSATYGALATYYFNSLTVTNGAQVVCTAQANSPYTITNAGVAIQSAGDVTIGGGNITNSIHADGKGFPRAQGPGGGAASGTGGTHGGSGCNNAIATYGSYTAPTTLGSGGYGTGTTAGEGGGAIKLIVPGTLAVNGRLSANGAYGRWGGGAGGSLWITGSGTVTGVGEIQVSGGQSEIFNTSGGGGGRVSIDDTVTYNFRGNIRGSLYKHNEWAGDAGTVNFPATARQNFTVFSNQIIVVGAEVDNLFSNLTVYGTLIPAGRYAGWGTCCVVRATNILIATGGKIMADEWGFARGRGPAPGPNNNLGGSHGGRGGGLPINTYALYGSFTQPTSMGSGGGAGGGGGAIKLVVSSNLTVNGTLSANGPDSTYSVGAGGSLWITGGGTLGGTGEVQAYGGGSYYNGGGGGGRISVDDTMSYAFKGNIRAGNVYDSCPGTVYLPAAARANFLIDTNQIFIVGSGTNYAFGDLMVKGTLVCGGDTTGQGTGIVIAANNITIWSNATVNADSRGFLTGVGPAAGSNTVGGTHAGIGYGNTNVTYGSALQPVNFGSGGQNQNWNGNARHAGGAIRLIVTSNLTIYGSLTATGAGAGTGIGASAGGSLWVDCGGLLAGTGTIQANGGATATPNYGGGGGRIAIYYGSNTFVGMPPPIGLYTNKETISATVRVRGGYYTSTNGVEDGSIYVRSMSAPFVDNATGATNITSSSAWLTGNLISTGAAATTVYCFWGTSDGTNNASAWGHTDLVSTAVGLVTNYVSGLSAPPATYYYRYYATNAFGDFWAWPSMSFQTIAPPVVNNDVGATGVEANRATLNGRLTDGGSAHVYIYWGTSDVSPETSIDLGTRTVAGGTFSADITGLTPLSHYYYQCYATNINGDSWAGVTDFWTTTTLTLSTNTVLTPADKDLYCGFVLVVSACTLTLGADTNYGSLVSYCFGGLIVTNGGAVVCMAQTNGPVYDANARGVAIQSTGDVMVAAGSSINADYRGFPMRQGPGGAAAADWMGGTYGGRGDYYYNACNPNPTYGSYDTPCSLGSGGRTAAGVGGGAVKLSVGGRLTVNGRLSANGKDDPSFGGGGGAGGSIWITGGGTLRGSGEIQVSGGVGEYAGSSGGGGGRISIDDTMSYDFRGNIRGALGAQRNNYGGVGSVYIGAIARQDFTVFSNQILVAGNDIENVFGNLAVYGTLVPGGMHAGLGTGAVIRATNITVAAGGSISADGWGWVVGPGAGTYNVSGGSHGGRGGSNVKDLYGSVTEPTSMGSGSTGAGGGAMKLVVSSNLIVNGSLSANGIDNLYSDGAGGSIWITGGGTLGGTGVIQAVGGYQGYGSTSGGGGRISIDDTVTYAFKGNVWAGKNYNGVPGTLYLPAAARQNFLIDTNQSFIVGSGTIYAFGDLTVKGTLDCGGDPLATTGLVITANNLTIWSNAVVTADSRGYYGYTGPGAGNAGTGATHAGVGFLNTSATYGSALQPLAAGSGGYSSGAGGQNATPYFGGGAIRMAVKKTLTVNGRLSANGGVNGVNGGSAGGSLWIDAGLLAGSGSIRADGGASAAGGGGGRIAITYRRAVFGGLPPPGLYTNQQSISATVTAKGGYNTSTNGVEDGSIYIVAIPQGSVFMIW